MTTAFEYLRWFHVPIRTSTPIPRRLGHPGHRRVRFRAGARRLRWQRRLQVRMPPRCGSFRRRVARQRGELLLREQRSARPVPQWKGGCRRNRRRLLLRHRQPQSPAGIARSIEVARNFGRAGFRGFAGLVVRRIRCILAVLYRAWIVVSGSTLSQSALLRLAEIKTPRTDFLHSAFRFELSILFFKTFKERIRQ